MRRVLWRVELPNLLVAVGRFVVDLTTNLGLAKPSLLNDSVALSFTNIIAQPSDVRFVSVLAHHRWHLGIYNRKQSRMRY